MTLSWLTTRLIPTLPTPFLGIGNKTMRPKIALETTSEGIKFQNLLVSKENGGEEEESNKEDNN